METILAWNEAVLLSIVADLGGHSGFAGLLHADMNFAAHQHCGGQHPIPHAPLHRLRFAGQHVLVNRGIALLDHAVDGDHLPGVQYHNIVALQGLEGHFDFVALHKQPDCARLLREDVDQTLLRAGPG